MKMLRRSVCLLLCAALFLTLLAGCGKQEEPAEDFVVSAAVCGPLETLDPTMNTDVGAESLLSTLFEGLMRMRDDGAGKAVAVAGIAKEYIEEKNYDDTVTYTFTLRSAARWSDGERVTAEDFVYAWQRLVDPATASPNASLLSMVAGYDEVRESGDVSLLGVKAKGESTFLVTLSRPCAYFITSVCTSPATAPLRRDLVEGNASWAATADIVTNGPYTVGTWVKAAQLQTKRNGEYYESKLVVPDSICFRFETDAQTNYDQLLAGELDYTAKLPYAAIEQLAEDETWQPAPLAETVCVLYNHLTDTFSDAQLRRAFDLAIDRAALAEQLCVTATAAKRREYARWARERDAYIIEDDYDAEFSALLKPVETVFSLAPARAIYMNTFTKTIAPAMRMGYMVLPGGLLARFEEQLGFYSCTVPVFEQYVLAEFIRSGELERYINRRRRALRARLKP